MFYSSDIKKRKTCV